MYCGLWWIPILQQTVPSGTYCETVYLIHRNYIYLSFNHFYVLLWLFTQLSLLFRRHSAGKLVSFWYALRQLLRTLLHCGSLSCFIIYIKLIGFYLYRQFYALMCYKFASKCVTIYHEVSNFSSISLWCVYTILNF
jgi:hypothetical protein